MRTEITRTESGSEVLTAAQAKQYLKQDYGIIAAEDAIVERQITAARQLCELYIDQTIVTSTLICQFFQIEEWDKEANGSIVLELPRGPVTSVTTVERVTPGVDDAELTLDSDYYLLGQGRKRVIVDYNNTVTRTGAYNTDGYKVEYVAGMSTVPKPLLDGILKTVADMYENRGNQSPVEMASLTFDSRALWNPYRQTINA